MSILRRARFAGLAALALSVVPAASFAADTYVVDPVHSSVVFRVKHMNTSFTWGRFNTISGAFTADHDTPANSKLAITVEAGSIDTANAKRDDHLKGPDFFNTKQFPEITFKSTAVKAVEDDAYDVTGDLTLHGVTRPVTARIRPTGSARGADGRPIAGLEANFTIKRSDFGMAGMVGPVADEVWVNISVEAVQQ